MEFWMYIRCLKFEIREICRYGLVYGKCTKLIPLCHLLYSNRTKKPQLQSACAFNPVYKFLFAFKLILKMVNPCIPNLCKPVYI